MNLHPDDSVEQSWLRRLLVCPQCRRGLTWSRDVVLCGPCRSEFPIVDGIPVMLIEHPSHPDWDLKRAQAAFFGAPEENQFETERPHGTPAFYQWLLEEKFRRSLIGLDRAPEGSIAITVCGGSGMDAEFLCKRGFIVISTDLSLGAAQNARRRAARYDLALFPVVADVEHLPFRDLSVHLAYVHDGLHHLTDPYLGLKEMARVAAGALSLTEPAAAAVTSMAVKVGLADEIEESGNRVARLQSATVCKVLEEAGFNITHTERYAMYYRHRPGPIFRALSTKVLLPLAANAWRSLNRLLGNAGNKLTTTAARRST